MNRMPAISVIVPVYNVEAYLAECLESILAQDFQDLEIICVNDGATDGSGSILEKYAAEEERIRVISQENQGLSSARNTGISAAKGEYLCFVDSDDILKSGALKKLYETAQKYMTDIVSYETAELLFEDESLRQQDKADYYMVKGHYAGLRKGREFFCAMVENDDYVDSACLLFISRKWLFAEHILFEPGKLYEDAMFSLQCYFRCRRMVHLQEGLYTYRVRKNSIMTDAFAYRHAYSRIWLLDEVLRARYVWAGDEREANAIAAYAMQVVGSLKYCCLHMPEEETSKLSDMPLIYEFFVKSLDLVAKHRDYHASLCLEGLLSVAGTTQNVIIYGVGQIGRKVYAYFCQNNKQLLLKGFAVSGIPQIAEYQGVPCRSIVDWPVSASTMLIIAANRKNRPAMEKQAKALGFTQLYPIDYEMESWIDKALTEER